ncbi:hypothetical protein L195_g006690 [Trifolium pratense]|uniref:HAT family dimerization domain containing protein n=1 Tax=Trifolium pratense TaxID=57577 RepID=A0A2K3P4A7_TRIPR|nr:hypothetical protein L195_g006690 [Trifolium pratense]
MFGGELATRALKTKTPAQWWESYGDTCPELQRSTPKKRNCLKQKTMNDVVFVMVNSRLNKKKQARKGKDYDIEDLASDDEWVADNVEDNSDLHAPIEVGEEDANGGIGVALGDDLEIPNDNDHAEDEIDKNEDHMDNGFPKLGLNNIIDI